MRNIFVILGWLTVPGLMNLMCIHEARVTTGSVGSVRTRITLGLSFVAMLIYGTIAIYFGDPSFRNTGKEILSPLSALVWLPNFLAIILCAISLFVTKGERE